MNWESLRVFVFIATHKNLKGASEALKLSHSTIFRRLNSLEEEIGCRVFDRKNGTYELTHEGKDLFRLSQPAIESFQSIERYVIGKDHKPSGVVKITTPTSFAYNFLTKNIQSFHESFPDIHLELNVSSSEIDMNTRDADIAVRIGNSPPSYLVGRQIKQITWSTFASKSYISKHGPVESIDDLQKHSLIGASGKLALNPNFRKINAQYAKHIKCRTDDLTMMSLLAKESAGVAIMPNDLELSSLVKMCDYKQADANNLWVLTHPELRNLERIKIVMKFIIATLEK